jgi:Adenylate kinase
MTLSRTNLLLYTVVVILAVVVGQAVAFVHVPSSSSSTTTTAGRHSSSTSSAWGVVTTPPIQSRKYETLHDLLHQPPWVGVRRHLSSSSSSLQAAPVNIIIAGAPASGKGTQCEIIKERFGVVHLSTGDMLRAAVAAGSEVGKLAKDYMDNGKLVPDEVIIGVVSLSRLVGWWVCFGWSVVV